MPAGAVTGCWAAGVWADTVWETGVWASSGAGESLGAGDLTTELSEWIDAENFTGATNEGIRASLSAHYGGSVTDATTLLSRFLKDRS